MKGFPEDLLGRPFGKWIVIKKLTLSPQTWAEKYDSRIWLCKCACGRTQRLSSGALKEGRSKSCRWCVDRSYKRIRPYESLYNRILVNAKAYGKSCDLTYEEFIECTKQIECHYCGMPVEWTKYNLACNSKSYNLDRK